MDLEPVIDSLSNSIYPNTTAGRGRADRGTLGQYAVHMKRSGMGQDGGSGQVLVISHNNKQTLTE